MYEYMTAVVQILEFVLPESHVELIYIGCKSLEEMALFPRVQSARKPLASKDERKTAST